MFLDPDVLEAELQFIVLVDLQSDDTSGADPVLPVKLVIQDAGTILVARTPEARRRLRPPAAPLWEQRQLGACVALRTLLFLRNNSPGGVDGYDVESLPRQQL